MGLSTRRKAPAYAYVDRPSPKGVFWWFVFTSCRLLLPFPTTYCFQAGPVFSFWEIKQARRRGDYPGSDPRPTILLGAHLEFQHSMLPLPFHVAQRSVCHLHSLATWTQWSMNWACYRQPLIFNPFWSTS